MNTRQALAVIPFVLVLLLCGAVERSEALLADHDCSFCHDFHGNPGYSQLLVAESSEMVCLSCHTVSMGETDAAEVHNPLGLASNQPGYITCRECHDAHDSRGGNVKMVGYKRDAENWSASFAAPGIRKELPTTVGLTYNVVTFSGLTDFNIAGAAVGACEVCHTPPHGEGENCIDCHGHNGGFMPSGGGDCRVCHDGSGAAGTALAVSVDSPHSTNTLSVAFTCENCHTDHENGSVLVPNNSSVGINYSYGGISLGNSSGGPNDATGSTEAEICWNCHSTMGVSEWGLNTETNGSFPNYDSGSLSGPISPAWVNADGSVGATWSSANFTYKEGGIQSTHSVNESVGVSGRDAVANIRCSYCHDVHDTYGTNTGSGPFLRGSWVGNPYREDGAPRSDASPSLPGDAADYSAYDVAAKFGAVPRGGATYDVLGGYFIDQNSNNPTDDLSMDSPDKFAGLCRLCHEGLNGTQGDNLWQAAEINSLNKFGSPADDWVGNNNSHAAVVKGGDGSGASNLFVQSKRFPTTPWSAYTSDGSQGGNPVMAYQNSYAYNSRRNIWEGVFGQGLRGTDSTAFQYLPRVDIGNRGFNYSFYAWGATVNVVSGGTMNESGIDSGFHQFTCSKCHSPHASRLPRLLITNCLDTNHNTWDDAYITPASDTNGSSSSLSVENRSVSLSQVTSAQNCHRLADPNYLQAGPQGTATGGWNRVTPWREF